MIKSYYYIVWRVIINLTGQYLQGAMPYGNNTEQPFWPIPKAIPKAIKTGKTLLIAYCLLKQGHSSPRINTPTLLSKHVTAVCLLPSRRGW